jgi:hypothetical protein
MNCDFSAIYGPLYATWDFSSAGQAPPPTGIQALLVAQRKVQWSAVTNSGMRMDIALKSDGGIEADEGFANKVLMEDGVASRWNKPPRVIRDIGRAINLPGLWRPLTPSAVLDFVRVLEQ